MSDAPRQRDFSQVDVFTATPLLGNPLAVVHDGGGLSIERMQAFARWTNLSETTFLLPPTNPEADYRVRIFTPGGELPFAGHPTLGSCHVWLAAGGTPRHADTIVQECEIGLVPLRRGARLAFAAPPTSVERADAELLHRVYAALGLEPARVRDAAWLSNGFPQLVLLVDSAATVLALKPDHAALKGLGKVGVVAPHPAGGEADFEVRFFAAAIGINEDPVTGSLNANVARWLIDSGRAPVRYVAAQGTAMGRAGRIHVQRDDQGTWIGGDVAPCIAGTVML
ncbi:PhzF family phenazine biosynthesis protein [Scleromatobacter humisilvae]|uniref:PhzF family phenazine biosynthesis protein n=1 Tax=Scleromatobacter humisilvae TaxID=2897159 RepID=A0A9X1YMD3_9BURK|nr:PhzF family phenazine biosynthesis protein [Scleromatobacter humisilvae]MCK9688808.1 PhzF family phenazine biosynthesis protein [Scleromatobacter humisilvae]